MTEVQLATARLSGEHWTNTRKVLIVNPRSARHPSSVGWWLAERDESACRAADPAHAYYYASPGSARHRCRTSDLRRWKTLGLNRGGCETHGHGDGRKRPQHHLGGIGGVKLGATGGGPGGSGPSRCLGHVALAVVDDVVAVADVVFPNHRVVLNVSDRHRRIPWAPCQWSARRGCRYGGTCGQPHAGNRNAGRQQRALQLRACVDVDGSP